MKRVVHIGTHQKAMQKDTRGTARYQEAEALYGALRQAGAGLISYAAEVSTNGLFSGALVEALAERRRRLFACRIYARACKVAKEVGTLERGKFAGLVILDRNAFENAENYPSISLFMKERQDH
jgi:hypothetical protein